MDALVLKNRVLRILNDNARYSKRQLAAMLDITEEDVTALLHACEQDGTIRGYKAIVDWEKTDREFVTAFIEIKVSPKRQLGFDETAQEILRFKEVESLFLMSGGFDLCAIVNGKSLKEISSFVVRQLGTLDSVLSFSTHFVLKKYKDNGFEIVDAPVDERRHPTL